MNKIFSLKNITPYFTDYSAKKIFMRPEQKSVEWWPNVVSEFCTPMEAVADSRTDTLLTGIAFLMLVRQLHFP